MKKPLPMLCVRTAMIGGGNAYDVYVPRQAKHFHPIAFNHYYATIIDHGGRE